MREIYEKNKKKIIICVVILIIVLLIWLIVLKPFLTFKQNEKTMMEAAKRYYEINNSALPTGKRISTVTLQKLYDKDLISKDLTTSYTSKLCDAKKSWVKVKKEDNDYKYYAYLKCGIYSSNIDHEGPIITLKGTDTVTINKGDSWTDPGVSSVIDDTDGNLDVKEVKVKSNVNTNKNGTYTITYTIRDSFKNETVKTRTVKVVQILDQIVKNDTRENNGYYKMNDAKYIKLDGILFQIVGMNDNDTVKIVSSETLAYVDKDSADDWLNEYFYSKLSDNAKKYIVSTKFCNEKVTNPENYTKCNKYSSKKNVGLLSIADINNSSIISNNKLLTSNNYYENVMDGYGKVDNKTLYAITPVLNLKKDINLSSGSGTVDNPFIIPDNKSSKPGTKISDLKVGEYISYSGYDWRIIGADNGYTQVVMNDALKSSDITYITANYGKGYYNPNNKDTLAYKIVNKYSKYLKTSKFVKHNIDVYQYTNKISYNTDAKKKTYKVKTSEVSAFDLFSSSSISTAWFKESHNGNKNSYYESANGYRENNRTEEEMIKITAFFDKNIVVTSGKGTNKSPYKIK